MKSSKYQQNIYEWIENGKGNAIVQAVAGSGKTTTIVEATKLLSKDKECLFVAFNKAIAMELKDKLPLNIKAQTLHSLGLSMFIANTNKRPQVKFDKLKLIIIDVLKDNDLEEEDKEFKTYFGILNKVIRLIKATLTDYEHFEELDELFSRFDINFEIDDKLISYIGSVLNRCKQDVSTIDFDDMVWIPIANNFQNKSYDWVFCDEVQDLNKSQLELIKKVCNGSTRIVGVGDKRQSIYAFRGADTLSMDNFKRYFKAKELPLSICYRCPQKVIELAKTIVPEIEVNPEAIPGKAQVITYDNVISKAQDGDLILCRTNAPLVKVAFNLIRMHKKAIVRGRDIGKNLIKIVDKYKCTNLNDLISKVLNFQQLQEEKLLMIERGDYDRKKKYGLMVAVDSCETIMVIAENVRNIEMLKIKIEEIFSDEREGIVCSSIHKAKGLEADNVFIINYLMMPHPMASTQEELEQEDNIKYVAITRAKKALYLLDMIEDD